MILVKDLELCLLTPTHLWTDMEFKKKGAYFVYHLESQPGVCILDNGLAVLPLSQSATSPPLLLQPPLLQLALPGISASAGK